MCDCGGRIHTTASISGRAECDTCYRTDGLVKASKPQLRKLTKAQVAAAVQTMAERLEKLNRCNDCKGHGTTTECFQMSCDVVFCRNREHLETRKCILCRGSGYRCDPQTKQLFAKYIPDPEGKFENVT